MERDIITVYCLIDEYLKVSGIKDDVRAEISNAEVLLIGYMAVNDFSGNYYKAHQYSMMMQLVKRIDYTRFLRRLAKINEVLSTLFLFLGSLFQRLNGAKIYSVDSFPVELCQITRQSRVRLWSDPSLKGYNASKGRFFYGLKVHMVVTTDKEPVMVHISEGSIHDVTAGYQFMHYLPQKSITIGDKGYVSSKLEAFLKQFEIVLSPIGRNNMQQENKEEYFTKRRIRKGVETAFSMITAKFGKVIKATTIGGFLTKLRLFITAYAINCFLKLSDDKKALLFNQQFGFIDLDNFKVLNDTKGHEYGDILLKQVAKRLTSVLCLCDTVSRFGGDEFVVLVTKLGEDEKEAKEKMAQIGYKLLLSIAEPFHLINFDYTCTASIGGTVFKDDDKTINDILRDADMAMYEVKKEHKNEIKIV